MKSRKSVCRVIVLGGLLATGLLLAGCGTTSSQQSGGAADAAREIDSDEVIHKGTSLVISFSDTVNTIKDFEERVNEEGMITLIENESFVAEGKTRSQLEKEIRARYVPKYYRRLTVIIKPQERMIYVDGEVRNQGRPAYSPPMTVLKAITAAGGFTDFANRKRVIVTRRNGKKERVNCFDALRDSSKDLPIYPGDSIHVPRKIL